MEFLVQMTINLPRELTDTDVDALIASERAHGMRLLRAGRIMRIWRVNGGNKPNRHVLRNVGIWAADDRYHLDRLLSSLPMWPYASAEITDLETHPLEQQ